MRVMFVTNYCPHYRVRTFETLAQRIDVEFVFFSTGDEWYWERRLGFHSGAFAYRRVAGFKVAGLAVNPGLLPMLWKGTHDVYVKDINGPVAVLVTLIVAKWRRKPLVLWTGMWRHPRTVFHLLTYPFVRLLYRLSDGIVVYGVHVKSYLMSIGVRGEKIFIAPHAIDNAAYGRAVGDSERRTLRQRLGIDAQRVVLYVGRLEVAKGLEVLVRAFALSPMPDARLVLVGDGSLRARLTDLAAQLGIADRVVFVGYVPPEETVAFYSVAEVLVLPSVTVRAGREPWGLVVNEAMNQGVPVIATTAVGAAVGGLVQPGRNGEIVPERDPVALANAIARLLGDTAYREHLSQGARDVIAAWDNYRMVSGFVEAVEFALASRGLS